MVSLTIPQHIYIFGIVLLRLLRFSWWNLHQYAISPHYLTQLRCCTHVTHALGEASSARSFSIVLWTLFQPWPLYRPWTPWSTHLKKLGNIYLNGLVKTIPKIYICWGIVGDTNLTNFHKFSPIITNFHQFLDQFSENGQKILTGSTRWFQKYIYVWVL